MDFFDNLNVKLGSKDTYKFSYLNYETPETIRELLLNILSKTSKDAFILTLKEENIVLVFENKIFTILCYYPILSYYEEPNIFIQNLLTKFLHLMY